MSASSRSPEPEDPRPGSDRPKPFNLERFLLHLVAVVLIAEVSVYGGGGKFCAWRGALGSVPAGGVCARFDNAVHTAFGVALNTLLALPGGKALCDSQRPQGP